MYEYRVVIRGLEKLHDGSKGDDDMGIKDKKMLEMGLAVKSYFIIRLLHIILFMLVLCMMYILNVAHN